jgi:alpha-amylase
MTLHYSGFLLEWLVQEHPEFVSMIREMVDRGQVEIMSGGFYEPIFTTLYDSDKIGQIHKLSSFIRETFGMDPRGMWLAERVWEPHLAETLCNAGAEYIVIDDHHFIMAGLRGKSLYGYYITEEKGRIIKVFPGSEKLRYLIPFRPVEETLAFLQEVRESSERPLAIMGDDGEKFGVWPGTYHSVYEEGWLRRFFGALEQNQDWIETRLFSETIAAQPPLGRIYLPTSSYMEMGEWSMIYDASEEFRVLKQKLKDLGMEEISRPFLSGGFWRNFFSKYPESNLMHKKMLFVSEKIHHLPEGRTKESALNELWKGQCNDAYWHGVFGGLYLPHLRSSIYEHLIRAETIADQALHEGEQSWIQALSLDLDKDGNREEILSTESYTLVAAPQQGGTIMELDFKPRSFNLQDTFTRVPEFYHKEIVDAPTSHQEEGEATSIHDRIVAKEEGLAEQIVYDPYPRRSLIDHFLGLNESLESFRTCRHLERGDFVQGAYQAERSGSTDLAEIIMERTGWVRTGEEGPSPQQVRIRKIIQGRAGDASLTVLYNIQNLSEQDLVARFGVELNITMLAGNAPDRYFTLDGERPDPSFLSTVDEASGIHSVHLVDEWKGIEIKLSWDRTGLLWRFPIETVSLSEAGFEKIYQGSSVVPLWDIHLAPQADLDLKIGIELCSIPDQCESTLQSQEVHNITE